jgi:hypothetical protein
LPEDELVIVTRGSAEHLDEAEARVGRDRIEYVAERTEKLADVAKKFGLTAYDLARINRISSATTLEKGDKVIVYKVVDPKRSERAEEQWKKLPKPKKGKQQSTKDKRVAEAEPADPGAKAATGKKETAAKAAGEVAAKAAKTEAAKNEAAKTVAAKAPEGKPETKPAGTPENKLESKPENQIAESTAAAASEPDSATKAAAKTEPRTEAKSEPKSEPKSEAKSESKPEPATRAAQQSKEPRRSSTPKPRSSDEPEAEPAGPVTSPSQLD